MLVFLVLKVSSFKKNLELKKKDEYEQIWTKQNLSYYSAFLEYRGECREVSM